MPSPTVPISPLRFALTVFAPFGFAYVLGYALRTVNAAIAPQLTAEFGINAEQLGFLTAAYFLAFAFTQLPLGGWLDRFRPRRVEAALMVVCALGCFVFAAASSVHGLIVGRILIGVGVAACLMASIRTFSQWLAAERLPAMNGYILAVGNAGAMASTAPVLWLLGFISWSQMFVAIGGLSIAVAAWLAFAVPDPGTNIGNKPSPATLSRPLPGGEGWRSILRSPMFWALAPITCVVNATGLAVQGLWAGPWLIDVAGVARNEIGGYLLLVSAGMLCSNLLLGMWMGRIVQRDGSALWFAAIACAVAFVALLPWTISWQSSPAVLLACFGLTHAAGSLVFAALVPQFAKEVAGRLVTTLNFFMFGLGFLLQWGIGIVVNQYPTQMAGLYQAAGYERAFLLLAVLEFAAIVWTLFALPRALRQVGAKR